MAIEGSSCSLLPKLSRCQCGLRDTSTNVTLPKRPRRTTVWQKPLSSELRRTSNEAVGDLDVSVCSRNRGVLSHKSADTRLRGRSWRFSDSHYGVHDGFLVRSIF